MMTIPTQEKLVKHSLADLLRTEIMNGALRSGERIIEAKWAARFNVAQGSIREAINILTYEGFLTKQAGRSARVIHYTEQDVLQLYEVRGALEGLAARLVANARADISALRFAMDGMREASQAGHREALLDCDLQFHRRLCEASANPFLIEQSRRILLPFFAFVRIRVAASGQDTTIWCRDLEAHQRIVDLISDNEGELAEQYVRKAMQRFAATAYSNWGNQGSSGNAKLTPSP